MRAWIPILLPIYSHCATVTVTIANASNNISTLNLTILGQLLQASLDSADVYTVVTGDIVTEQPASWVDVILIAIAGIAVVVGVTAVVAAAVWSVLSPREYDTVPEVVPYSGFQVGIVRPMLRDDLGAEFAWLGDEGFARTNLVREGGPARKAVSAETARG